MADPQDFDPTGMTVQQLQAAGHDVSLAPPAPPTTGQDQDFDPTGMTVQQLQDAGHQVSLQPQQQTQPPAPEGGIASTLRAAAHSVVPTIAGVPGMMAGGEAGFEAGLAAAPFLGPLAPAAPFAGALIGGAAGAYATGSVGEAAQNAALDATGLNDAEQRRSNAEAHPYLTGAGEVLPAFATFEVGNVGDKIAQRLLTGGGMMGIDMLQQKAEGKDINWGEAATSGVLGATLGKPRGPFRPMAETAANFGRTAGENIPGVQSGRDFLNAKYPPGRPDLAYDDATTAADKKAATPTMPTTSETRGASTPMPPPRKTDQPFTGYSMERGNGQDQRKDVLKPQTATAATSTGPDEAILMAMNTAKPQQPPAAQAAIDTNLAQRPQQPPTPATPQPTQPPRPIVPMTPEDQQALQNRQLPFEQQQALLQSSRPAPQVAPATPTSAPAAPLSIPEDLSIPSFLQRNKPAVPPAAQAAIETSKAPDAAPKRASQVLQSQLNQPPAEPAQREPTTTDELTKLARMFNPNATPVTEATPAERPTKQISDRVIAALRATGIQGNAQIADRIEALPAGADREQLAAQMDAAMKSMTGEAPKAPLKNVRTRDYLGRLEVTNPRDGTVTRTNHVYKAMAYNKIHDINDAIFNDERFQPPLNADGSPKAETKDEVMDRVKGLLNESKTQSAAAADEMQELAKTAEGPEKDHLMKAAILLRNGKLPVQNYTMNAMLKPPAWRLQRHALDLVNRKVPADYSEQTLPDGTTQRVKVAEPWQKFLANEALIRGGPDAYSVFERDNADAAATSKKQSGASDITNAENLAARQASETMPQPGTAIERPPVTAPASRRSADVGTPRWEDRILDKMRSQDMNKAAAQLEQMEPGAARQQAFQYMENRVLRGMTDQEAKQATSIAMQQQKTGPGVPPEDAERIRARQQAEQEAMRAGRMSMSEALDKIAKMNENKNVNVLGNVEGILKGDIAPPPTEAEAARAKRVSPKPEIAAADFAKRTGDELRKLEANRANFRDQMVASGEWMKKNLPAGLFDPAVYRAKENGEIDTLPTELYDAYQEHLKPLEDAKNQMAQNISKYAPKKIGPLMQNHTGRILLNGDAPPTINSDLYETANNPNVLLGRRIVPGQSMRDRVFEKLEYADGPNKGQSQVIGIEPDNQGFRFWNNGIGTAVKDPKFNFEYDKPYTAPDGQNYIMRQATTDEITKNALLDNGHPPQYAQNLPLSQLKSLADLVHFGLAHEYFTKLPLNPEFRQHATNDPEDPRVVSKQFIKTNLPALKGWYMEPDLAYELDDYNKAGFQDDSWDWMRSISRAITSFIYLFPTVHALNVAAFGFVQRGWNWLPTNGNYRRLLETGTQAMKIAMAGPKDELFQELRARGLTLMDPSDNALSSRLGQVTGTEIKNNWKRFEPLAKVFGEPTRALVQSALDKSGSAMWTFSNMVVLQAVLEREAQGMGRQEAIKAVEQIIPNYQVGIRALAGGNMGRFLAKAFSDPLATAFGPYHIGVLRSFGNMAKNAVKGSADQKKEAYGQLAALAFLAFALKPALDKVAQTITGNPNSELRPPGPLTIPTNIFRAATGRKDISAAARDIVTIPPLANTAEGLLTNRNFGGKPIVQPKDVTDAMHGSPKAAGRALLSAGQYAARGTVAPYNIAMQGMAAGETPVGTLRDQLLGISTPSPASVRYAAQKPKFDVREWKQDVKHTTDPMKRLFNRVVQ